MWTSGPYKDWEASRVQYQKIKFNMKYKSKPTFMQRWQHTVYINLQT